MSVDKKKKAIEELEINNDMEGKLHDLQLSSDVGKDSGKYNAETALDAEVTSKENVEVDECGSVQSPHLPKTWELNKAKGMPRFSL